MPLWDFWTNPPYLFVWVAALGMDHKAYKGTLQPRIQNHGATLSHEISRGLPTSKLEVVTTWNTLDHATKSLITNYISMLFVALMDAMYYVEEYKKNPIMSRFKMCKKFCFCWLQAHEPQPVFNVRSFP